MPRLLIADDEEETRDVLARFFASRNYQIVEASSGEEALRVVDEQPLDAVLLDINMPGMDGLEALARINERRPDLPVVMVTGLDDELVARAAVEKGAFDYLVKPPDFEYLSQTLFVKLQLKWGDFRTESSQTSPPVAAVQTTEGASRLEPSRGSVSRKGRNPGRAAIAGALLHGGKEPNE